jgi:hypothetical protein
MKKIFTLFVLVVLMFCCSKEKSKEIRREVIDGVEHVYNPATPKYLEKKIILNNEHEFKHENLFRPVHIAVNSKNEVAILDRADNKINFFDAEGKLLTKISGKGKGPGEFVYVQNFEYLKNDVLICFDPRNKRISEFMNRKFIKSSKVKGGISRFFLIGENEYYRKNFEQGNNYTSLFLCNYNGVIKDSLTGIKKVKTKASYNANGQISSEIPYPILSKFTEIISNSNNNKLIVNEGNELNIKVYTGNDLQKIIHANLDQIEIKYSDKEKLKEQYFKYDIKIEINDFLKNFPIVSSIITDDKNNLWIETAENIKQADKGYKAYCIFNSEGEFEYKVWLGIKPLVIKNNKIYFINKEEDSGLKVVKKYDFEIN